MNEDRKKQIAVFRFGVIHEFVGGAVLNYGEQEQLLKEKCSRKWQIPYSNRTRISRPAYGSRDSLTVVNHRSPQNLFSSSS